MSRIIDDGAGGKRNAAEIEARTQALRGSLVQGVYNPPVDPATLSRAALDATREAMPLPAMRVYSHGGKIEADLKLRGADNAIEETKNEEGESREDAHRYARVQEGPPAFGVQQRAQGEVTKAGDSHRPENVWTEQVFEAESKEAVMALVPPGSKGVEVKRIWKASALVKQ